MTIRKYRPSDREALVRLWCDAFGDEETLPGVFFSSLHDLGISIVAHEQGKIQGMTSIITGCELVSPAGEAKKCAYIYAVAVDSSRRGEGVGKALVKAAGEISREVGCEILCTLPAEDWLYPYYEKHLGTGWVIYREKRTACASGAVKLRSLSAEEYLEARDRLLKGIEHMRPSAGLMRVQGNMCTLLGGGLFGFEGGIACGYAENGTGHITELLCGGEVCLDAAAGAVAQTLGTERAEYYIPGGDRSSRYMAFSEAVGDGCVWNLCLD